MSTSRSLPPVLAALLLLFSAATYGILSRSLHMEIDDTITQRAVEVSAAIDSSGSVGQSTTAPWVPVAAISEPSGEHHTACTDMSSGASTYSATSRPESMSQSNTARL